MPPSTATCISVLRITEEPEVPMTFSWNVPIMVEASQFSPPPMDTKFM